MNGPINDPTQWAEFLAHLKNFGFVFPGQAPGGNTLWGPPLPANTDRTIRPVSQADPPPGMTLNSNQFG